MEPGMRISSLRSEVKLCGSVFRASVLGKSDSGWFKKKKMDEKHMYTERKKF